MVFKPLNHVQPNGYKISFEKSYIYCLRICLTILKITDP